MDWNALMPQILGPLGTLILALTVIATGAKKVWLFLWTHETIVKGKDDQIISERKRADEWKEIALAGKNQLREVVTTVVQSGGPPT